MRGRLPVEAVGGTAGSFVGLGLGLLVGEPVACGDYIACLVGQMALGVGGSAVAGGWGAWLAGRWRHTDPSGLGALVGAVVGVAAGIVVVTLAVELSPLHIDGVPFLTIYAVTHGCVTAVFTRVL